MALTYGFLKGKAVSDPKLQATRGTRETQYHLHTTLEIRLPDGSASHWDSAINVGTNNSEDLLTYKLIFDFRHEVVAALRAAPSGFSDLTRTGRLPALDFLRSNLLQATGPWRPSDVMDGSTHPEPVASLLRLLRSALSQKYDVYVFGRKYLTGNGVHDVHMNQGSGGGFVNNGVDDHNDHNDVWQDGGVAVDVGTPELAAYFTAFTKQLVPTDRLGNPVAGGHTIGIADEGSLAR
jgi:hypothetical protein